MSSGMIKLMATKLIRWSIVLGALISTIIWLGISSLADEAVFQLVKANFDFSRTFTTVSIGSISIAIAWIVVVCVALLLSKSTNIKFLVQSAAVVAIWLTGLIVLSAILTYQFWDLRWGFGILIVQWFFEITISIQLVRAIFKQGEYGVIDHRNLKSVTIAFVSLTATKVVMLCLAPGVAIRT